MPNARHYTIAETPSHNCKRTKVNIKMQFNFSLTRFNSSSNGSQDSAVNVCARKSSFGRRVFVDKSNVSRCFIIDSIGFDLCFSHDSLYSSANSDTLATGLTVK